MYPINVTIDQGINLKLLKVFQDNKLIILHQAQELEQQFKSVRQQGKPFTLGVSKLDGLDMLVGEKFKLVEEIIGAENKKDILHIYSAYQNKSEYFITDNPDDFISKGKREKLEKVLSLKIRRTKEFLNEIESKL